MNEDMQRVHTLREHIKAAMLALADCADPAADSRYTEDLIQCHERLDEALTYAAAMALDLAEARADTSMLPGAPR